jgi:hypothetical protein
MGINALQNAPSTLQGQQCILAALCPTDRDKSLRELNDFADACIEAAENRCVLMYALII